MTTYNCELCKKSFIQKNDFTRHKSKKNSCISNERVHELIKKSKEETEFTQIFKSCLDILRLEGITGDKALRNLTWLLNLLLIQNQIDNNKIDLQYKNYNFHTGLQKSQIELLKNVIDKKIKFTDIFRGDEENVENKLNTIWKRMLSVHPKTKIFFTKKDMFNIKLASTYKKLSIELFKLDLDKIKHDLLGEAYEEMAKDVFVGKTLGQFFTQPNIKQMMVDLLKPKLFDDGTCESIYDPSMGTGGFLITAQRDLLKQSKERNIDMDYNYLIKDGLNGREIDEDTYNLACSNMFISTGEIINLEHGDSLRDFDNKKYDIIMANPPFGLKGIEYDEISNIKRDENLPIKSKNGELLFLQLIINKLKVGGRAAVVFPDGQGLFSKNQSIVNFRKCLMKCCDLKEVIYLPAGTFTHTGVKTCVFYFEKKIETDQVLNIENKGKKRLYKFNSMCNTKKIDFYEFNTENKTKNHLLTVDIDKVVENSYSLNYSEYIELECDEYGDDIEIKTLKEMCIFEKKSKRQAGTGLKEGKIPFYTSSSILNKYVNEADYNKKSIIIGTGGTANIKYSDNFSCSTDNFILSSKDINTNIKYIYYYLLNNIHLLQNGFFGSGLKHISKSYIMEVQIPLPTLEIQNKIVEYCEKNDAKITHLIETIKKTNIDSKNFINNVILL